MTDIEVTIVATALVKSALIHGGNTTVEPSLKRLKTTCPRTYEDIIDDARAAISALDHHRIMLGIQRTKT